LWTPGYWSWNDDEGYYWVPGTWVVAPVGMFWTPGWWGWNDGFYVFHGGYWGPHVGFYGGINYGFGYTGNGFYGGEWRGRNFYYNRSVTNVNVTRITNVYNRTVIVNNNTVNHVSYNGGNGGIAARPTSRQLAAEHERHEAPLPVQAEHQQAAAKNRELFARVNQGRPPVAATARPADFHSAVPARAAGAPYHAPSISPREARGPAAPANRPMNSPNPRDNTRANVPRNESPRPATVPRGNSAPRPSYDNKTAGSPRPSDNRMNDNRMNNERSSSPRPNDSRAPREYNPPPRASHPSNSRPESAPRESQPRSAPRPSQAQREPSPRTVAPRHENAPPPERHKSSPPQERRGNAPRDQGNPARSR
jgi:hypothetical protein